MLARQEASAKRPRVEEKGRFAEMEFGRKLLEGGVAHKMIVPLRGVDRSPAPAPRERTSRPSTSCLFDGWKKYPLFRRPLKPVADLAVRISEKILRALPLTRNDTANAEISVASPIGASSLCGLCTPLRSAST